MDRNQGRRMTAEEKLGVVEEGRLSGATIPVGKESRIVRDNGSQFVAKEWREVMRHFELEEIPIKR